MADSFPAAALPKSHREVIDYWPSLAIYAADVGLEYEAAKQQRRRNSIPDRHRVAAVAAARKRGIRGVTFELLTRLAQNSDAKDRAKISQQRQRARG